MHTTRTRSGADTLFAAVPVVHRASLAPVGRMMASMLRALRLQELIVMEASEVLTLARVLGAPAGDAPLFFGPGLLSHVYP